MNKVYALRQNIDNTDSDCKKLITNNVMLDKSCTFQFNSVDEREVRNLLKFLPEHSSCWTVKYLAWQLNMFMVRYVIY